MTTSTEILPSPFTPLQLDALREVANMGAGHAATALSQMTGGTIMISVPTIPCRMPPTSSPSFGSVLCWSWVKKFDFSSAS